MQHIYADMQLIYVDMQYIYGDIQLIYLGPVFRKVVNLNQVLTLC